MFALSIDLGSDELSKPSNAKQVSPINSDSEDDESQENQERNNEEDTYDESTQLISDDEISFTKQLTLEEREDKVENARTTSNGSEVMQQHQQTTKAILLSTAQDVIVLEQFTLPVPPQSPLQQHGTTATAATVQTKHYLTKRK